MNALERLATADAHWRAPFVTGGNLGAHLAQGAGHPLHGTLGQGRIAGELHIEGLPGQQAGEQAHGGARVAHVERFCRRLEAMQADPVDGHLAIVGAFDDHTHIPECL